MQLATDIICKLFKFQLTNRINEKYCLTYSFKNSSLFFDRLVFKYIPVATAMAFITWSYVTWLLYFMPFMGNFSLYTLSFALATVLSWYNFYKAWKTDPGVLISNRDQMNKVRVEFLFFN